MIRETLDPSATSAYVGYQASDLECLWDRTTTGGSTSVPGCHNAGLPYWLKRLEERSVGNACVSRGWTTSTKKGSALTISSEQTAYVGFALFYIFHDGLHSRPGTAIV